MVDKKEQKDYLVWGILVLAIIIVTYFIQSKPSINAGGYLELPTPSLNYSAPPISQIINVSLVSIKASGCDLCHGEEIAAERIKNLSKTYRWDIINETILESNSTEALEYITKYEITVLPTIIVSKEANKTKDFVDAWLDAGHTVESDGAFVLRDPTPPFLEDGVIYGLIYGVEIATSECGRCIDYKDIYKYLQRHDLVPVVDVYNYTDPKAQEYISKYNITKLPSLVIYKSGEMNGQSFVDFIDGFKEFIVPAEDAYIFANYPPPYFDLTSNETKDGIVSVVTLGDRYCADCYDPIVHADFLSSDPTNLFIIDVQQLDVNDEEGFNYITKYKITDFPTSILSKEAGDYPVIQGKWKGIVGSVEGDGSHIFRNMSQLKGVNYTSILDPRLVRFSVNTSLPLNFYFDDNRSALGVTDSFTALVPKTFVLNVTSEDSSSISRQINAKDTLEVKYLDGVFTIN